MREEIAKYLEGLGFTDLDMKEEVGFECFSFDFTEKTINNKRYGHTIYVDVDTDEKLMDVKVLCFGFIEHVIMEDYQFEDFENFKLTLENSEFFQHLINGYAERSVGKLIENLRLQPD